MLITPLGEIEIYIDDILVPYKAEKVACNKNCMNLNGRYLIAVNFVPDGKEHVIMCCIKDYSPSDDDCVETGEHLELKSFFFKSTKLSLGMEGEAGYLTDGTRISEYDYDNEYLANGVVYSILPRTKTSEYVFGIAWIDDVNDENEIQTWFGADVTYR